MKTFRHGGLVTSIFAFSLLTTACGGKSILATADAGNTPSDGSLGTTMTEPDGSVCVNIDPSSLDESCSVDTDCELVATGQLCSGACSCGNTPVGPAGEAAYRTATSKVSLASCPCADSVPHCLQHKCVACTGLPNDPADPVGCPDSGTVTVIDASLPPTDAAMCIEVSATSFSQACTADTDCTLITTGQLCSGSCIGCAVNTAINMSSLAAYESAISSLTPPTSECPCPPSGTARCLQQTCTFCGFGPNTPAGCADGG